MKEDSYQKPFEIQIQDKKILFSADNLYSRVWKLTRFRNNRMPEEKVSNILIKKFESCRCFVDVGANLGYYTFLASKFMPKGIIYSFEMDEKNYALLKKNLEINNCKNVNIYHSAVTDHPGFVSYSNTLKSPSPTLILSNQSPNKKFSLKKSVKAVSLDDFFKDKKLLPEIIKIDVEGSEINVLNGMQKLLKNKNLQLFLEVHPISLKLNFRSSVQEVISLLIDKGYNVSEIKKMRKPGKDIKIKNLQRDSQIMHNSMIYAKK